MSTGCLTILRSLLQSLLGYVLVRVTSTCMTWGSTIYEASSWFRILHTASWHPHVNLDDQRGLQPSFLQVKAPNQKGRSGNGRRLAKSWVAMEIEVTKITHRKKSPSHPNEPVVSRILRKLIFPKQKMMRSRCVQMVLVQQGEIGAKRRLVNMCHFENLQVWFGHRATMKLMENCYLRRLLWRKERQMMCSRYSLILVL